MLHEGCRFGVFRLLLAQVCTNAVTAELNGTGDNSARVVHVHLSWHRLLSCVELMALKRPL